MIIIDSKFQSLSTKVLPFVKYQRTFFDIKKWQLKRSSFFAIYGKVTRGGGVKRADMFGLPITKLFTGVHER